MAAGGLAGRSNAYPGDREPGAGRRQNQPAVAGFQDVRLQLRRERGIDRNIARARGEDGQDRRIEIGALSHADADGVAAARFAAEVRLEPGVDRPGDLRDAQAQVLVAERLCIGDERRSLRLPAHDFREPVHHTGHAPSPKTLVLSSRQAPHWNGPALKSMVFWPAPTPARRPAWWRLMRLSEPKQCAWLAMVRVNAFA